MYLPEIKHKFRIVGNIKDVATVNHMELSPGDVIGICSGILALS